jgi:hypothetical protein
MRENRRRLRHHQTARRGEDDAAKHDVISHEGVQQALGG